MAASYTGSCKCGAIKIEMQGEPAIVLSILTRHLAPILGLCHCNNCRKSTSAMFSVNAIFPKDDFAIILGETRVWEAEGGSGNPVYTNFCGNCSSTMFAKTPNRPDIVVVKVGILDGDAIERLTPMVETFTSRKPGWLKQVDGTIQHENGYPAPPSE
ncbi:hypothetical protein G7046_g6274 [Stylonectria norvegica]|nr:hypothetical protein G7046_g6274 [Stylonectria norvegica]